MPRLEIDIGLAGNQFKQTVAAIERLNDKLTASEKTTRLFGDTVQQQQARLRTYQSVLQSLLRNGLPTWNQHVQRLKTEIDKLSVGLEHQKTIMAQQAPMDALATKLAQIGNNYRYLSDTSARLNAELRANQAAIDGLIKQGVDPADIRITALRSTITRLETSLAELNAAAARQNFLQQFQKSGYIIPDLEQKIRNLRAALDQATDTRRIAQLNRRLHDAQEELTRLRNLGIQTGSAITTGMDRASTSTQRYYDTHRRNSNIIGGAITQLRSLAAAYASIHTLTALGRRSFDVALQTDAIETSLSFILKNSDMATDKLAKLREMATRLGLEYVNLAGTYRSFIGATEASNFSMAEADRIFGAVANAGAKLKLSTDQVRGTFLAIEQMISKGTVSMEELRRQLGDRLPGSFAMAARAMNMTEVELNKLVSSGQLLSRDLLPRLADELNKTYGNNTNEKIESLQASVSRLHNEFSDMVERGNVGEFFRIMVDGLTNSLSAFNNLVNSRSFNTFFMRLAGIMSVAGMTSKSLGAAAAAVDSLAESSEKLAEDPGYFVMQKFAKMNREEMEKTIALQKELVDFRRDEYRGQGGKALETLNYQAEILARMISHHGQLHLQQKKTDEGFKKTAGVNRLADALAESERRVALARAQGDEQEIQRIRNWYDTRFKLAQGNAAAIATLEKNMEAEIAAVRDKAAAEATAAGEKALADRRKKIAEGAAKNLEAIRKEQAKEAEVSLTFQRRLFESRSQIALRELNTEFEAREAALNKAIRAEIEANGVSEEATARSLAEKMRLQEEYFRRREELEARQREMNIQTAFDGDALSVPIARLNEQVAELKRRFEAGVISAEAFRAKISEIAAEREGLQLFQNSIDGISGAFGNLYADAIFNTENAMENLGKAFENTVRSILSGLIKIAVRYAINQALGTKSMAVAATTSAVTAKTVSAAWSTAAALVSAATFGANVAAGGAALGAFLASVKGLSGFRKGGYTGSKGINEIAGVVHGQEYVINARATRENLPLLQAINAGKKVVAPVSAGAVSSTGGGVLEVHVVGEISGENIKLLLDRAVRKHDRYFG